MSVVVVSLSAWTGVVPVVLPWGEPTIASVGVASAGVAVPFFLYVVAMFMVVVPMWMGNFESDKQAQRAEAQQQQQQPASFKMGGATMLTLRGEQVVMDMDGDEEDGGYPPSLGGRWTGGR